MVSWWRARSGDGDAPDEQADQPVDGGVQLWRDEDGVLVTGTPEDVRGLVAQLTELGGDQIAASPVVPTEALAVFATGYADGATQYVRFSDTGMALLDQYSAGTMDMVSGANGAERALAFQAAAIGLALRTAVKNVEAAVARVEDKVDEVVAMVRSERLGNVLGDRRTLDSLVAHLDAGDPLSSTDWSSVAALGPAITRDLEKLRAHLRTQIEDVDGSWRPRRRVNEADGLLASGLLTETLGLLLLAEHNFSQWQRLRIQRIADDEPDKLDAAIRQARAAMQEHLDADQAFLAQFEAAQVEILEPRDHDGFAVIQNRALERAESELTDLTRWFAGQRLLQHETVDARSRPGLRDSVTGVIDAGRRRVPAVPRPGLPRPSIPGSGRSGSDHPYQWAVDGPPLGTWRTFQGTFSNVMGAELTFGADGSGTVRRWSGMLGEDETPMLWRHLGSGELWVCLVFDDEDPADLDPDEAGERFRYEAQHQATDAGTSPVLMNHESEPDGWIPAGGFWTLDGPVYFVDPS